MIRRILLWFIVATTPLAMAQAPYTPVEVVPAPQTTPAPAPQGRQAPPGSSSPQMMQIPQGAGTPQGTQSPPPTPIARMYAIYGYGAVPEQPYMDKNLEPVAEALANLPFTSYEAVTITEEEVPWQKETPMAVNAKYTVNVTPAGQNEEGAIELLVRIEMLQEDGAYIDALKAQALAAQNGALRFRGMPLNSGELIVLLLVGMPPDPNEEGDKSQDQENQNEEEQQEQEQQEQEQQEQEQQKDSETEGENEGEEEGESSEEQEMNQQEESSAEGEGEPENIENLEALLESLEDTDKQEQKEERNQRSRIDFKGDWW